MTRRLRAVPQGPAGGQDHPHHRRRQRPRAARWRCASPAWARRWRCSAAGRSRSQRPSRRSAQAGGSGRACPATCATPRRWRALSTRWRRSSAPSNQLVNNAAGNFLSASEDLSPNAFNSVVQIVLYGTFHCTREVGRRLIERKQKGEVLSIVTTYVETRVRVRAALGRGQGGRARDDAVAGRGVGGLRHPPERDRARARSPPRAPSAG